MAARHILLALYLHHGDLHLPDPQLPALQAAALTPEGWADTAPEEIAAYLRITCRRFNTALGRRKGTPYPLSALLYTAHHPEPAQLKPRKGWASFGTPTWPPPTWPPPHGWASRTSAPTSEASRRASERHTAGTPAPIAPTGTGGFTGPRHPPGQEDQDRSGGPPARLLARRDAPTRARVQPHRTTPGPDPRGTPTAPPPPAPTTTTVPQHPNPAAQSVTPPAKVHTMPGPPYAQSQRTWHHQHHHHAPVPPNPYPLMPPCYSDPHQLHPHHAPAQPGPTNHPPHMAHITAPRHHVFHHHQPLPPHPPTPGYHTQPAHPEHHHHAVQHHPPPPLHGPTTHEPQYTPMDQRGAAHAHQQHQGLVGAPHGHQQPPQPHPIPASTIHQQPPITYRPQPHPDAHAAASHPHPGSTTSQGPRTARRTHATPTRPTGTPRPPASTTPTPAPPTTNSATPGPPPPAPPPRPGHGRNTRQPAPAN